jgi:hypothetical protein
VCLFCCAVSNPEYTGRNELVADNTLQRIRRETDIVVTSTSRHFIRGKVEEHKASWLGKLLSLSRFEPGASQLRVTSVAGTIWTKLFPVLSVKNG